MFIELAAIAGPGVVGANTILTTLRPLQVADLLENYWRAAAAIPPLAQQPDPDHARDMFLDNPGIGPLHAAFPRHHLAYAYCLENTRLYEIMRRVVFEYRHGERLPPADAATQRWLHTTEELFFSTPLPYTVRSITSSVRPDAAAVRRNAYYRMLGMDLNHGAEQGGAYPFVKAEAANRDFALVFEALLVEVWKGYINIPNIASENTTDDNAIDELVRRLAEMLNARRWAGNLAREEFDAVATLSWLFLTVAYNTAVSASLNAQAAIGIADRLSRIGERVGLAPHARSDSYFQLATPLSVVLRAIEWGWVPTPGGAAMLYAGWLQPQMLQIITHWSIATGRNLKDPTVRRPIGTVLAGTAPGAVGGNGHGSRIAAVSR